LSARNSNIPIPGNGIEHIEKIGWLVFDRIWLDLSAQIATSIWGLRLFAICLIQVYLNP